VETPVSGLFVTVEGGEGVGKSTQAARIAQRFRDAGREVVATREPGGTPVGDRIRAVLLDPDGEMQPLTETMLYEASRAEIVGQVIAPALERGAVVVCDRFYDSTTAYQAYARGLETATVQRLNLIATGGLRPDVTVLLALDPAVALERATRDGADRMEREALEFHQAVHEGFLAIAASEPDRFVVVGAGGSIDEVAARVRVALDWHPAIRRALGSA
jgi:dTMP kinase